MTIKLAAAALLAFLPVAATATESLTNGSFEAGFAGFTTSGNVAAASGLDYVAGAAGSGSPAAQANHFAAFGGGNLAGASSVAQSFTTIANRVYSVGFDAGAFNATSEQLVVGITGATGLTVSFNSGTSNLDQLFAHYVATFTGTGALTTLSFAVTATGGDNADVFVDNASVTSVPDAPTWALLVAGFGLVGVAARRRSVAIA